MSSAVTGLDTLSIVYSVTVSVFWNADWTVDARHVGGARQGVFRRALRQVVPGAAQSLLESDGMLFLPHKCLHVHTLVWGVHWCIVY